VVWEELGHDLLAEAGNWFESRTRN
jgi:hypothetical protein